MSLNKEYKEFSDSILNNDKFKELREDDHHGSNRYDHCRRVSYLSFLMAKLFKGNCEDVVKAGLLHDFFHGSTGSKEAISYLNHPKTSVKNAKKYFEITDNEAQIIETHMYHYALVKNVLPFINKQEKVKAKEYRPTSKEGFIVCISDLLVSIFEVARFKVRYDTCLYFLFVLNLMRY